MLKKALIFLFYLGVTSFVSVYAQTGEEVYEKACQTCHTLGVAGAPKVHNVEEWAPRLEKGMDELIGSVKTGLNAMPPGGMCFDCSDEDYQNAIEFMSAPVE